MKPKIIGLTGGIGSGKTTVAKMFQDLGVPVYIADEEAKKLNDTSKTIIKGLKKLLGGTIYSADGKLNRKKMASMIFNDAELLAKVNNLIHPEVAKHFEKWTALQTVPYVLKEAAILFESGSHKNCDKVILVTAPEEIRIKRVMNRDKVSREEVLSRMKNQWSEEEKRKLSDFIIENTDIAHTYSQVETLHMNLLKNS